MKAAPSLILSCFLLVTLSHSAAASNRPRQLFPPGPKSESTSTATESPTSTTSATSTTTSSQSTTSTTSTSSTSATAPTTAPTTSSTSTTTAPTLPPAVSTSLSTSIDSSGLAVTVTITNPVSSSTSSSASGTPTKTPDSGGSSGFSTGSIIGVSVAGGVAVIAIAAFFVWKFTRKRFSDFDDNEAIKWPELNTHGGSESHALPVHNTGRAGFDTGSVASLSRVPSISNYSTPDMAGGGPDPYAVPPLPHMNPNQPYRDDPTIAAGYYDPYRGPIPGTLEHGVDDYGEAIPMTQMGGPGPQAAYGTGRNSPAPYPAGRSSPGPQAAYGAGRISPGPQAAYNVGRASPGPQASYDAYGHRQ